MRRSINAFTVLATGKIPSVQEDWERNKRIDKQILKMESINPSCMDRIIHAISLANLRSQKTMFSKAVEELAQMLMEPYSTNNEEPELLEFEDLTQRLRDEYLNGSSNFLRHPNGKMIEIGTFLFSMKYAIQDGKVYEKNVGPLHHMKRTKKSKRMKVLWSYPYAKVYKSLEEYAEEHYGIAYNEEHGGYGIYYNPKLARSGKAESSGRIHVGMCCQKKGRCLGHYA